jgi:hypothetical protein
VSSTANRLRAYVDNHYLLGSPAGRELLDIADSIDALEAAASPVSGTNEDPQPAQQQTTYGDGDPLDPRTPMKGRREQS